MGDLTAGGTAEVRGVGQRVQGEDKSSEIAIEDQRSEGAEKRGHVQRESHGSYAKGEDADWSCGCGGGRLPDAASRASRRE